MNIFVPSNEPGLCEGTDTHRFFPIDLGFYPPPPPCSFPPSIQRLPQGHGPTYALFICCLLVHFLLCRLAPRKPFCRSFRKH
jgi:hypothetical protein